MRFLIFLILFIPTLGMAAGNDKDPEAVAQEIDFSEPPFWMFTYDEYSDLQEPQKKFYLENAGPAIRKIDGLENILQSKLDEAPEWYKSWDGIAKQVYIACRNEKLNGACKELAAVRVSTLKMKVP
jgi:hypothetical protein